MVTTEIEFIDTGNAPELFADGLHDVQVIGSVSRFVLFVFRQTPGGVWFKEPAFTCRMPNEAIGPAIGLTLRKTAATVVVPIIGAAARHVFLH